MSYEPSGELTTDEPQVGTSETWDTQQEWEAYQSLNNLQIENGVVRLASVLPDSGLLHDWEASNFDGSLWTDQEGSVNLSASGNPSLSESAYNGEPAVDLDGDGDYFEGTGIGQSTPIVVFAVVDLVDNGRINGLLTESNDMQPNILYRFDAVDAYRLTSGGESIEPGPMQTGQQINTFDFNGGSSSVRVNGSEIGTGSLLSDTLEDITVGRQVGFTDRDLEALVARLLIYDRSQMDSGQISDVESFLNNIYGAY